jgi:hypothetical protein
MPFGDSIAPQMPGPPNRTADVLRAYGAER